MRPLLFVTTALFVIAACGDDDSGSGGRSGGSSGAGATSGSGGSSGGTAGAASGGTAGGGAAGAASGGAAGAGTAGAATGGSAGSAGAAGGCTAPGDGLWATFDVAGESYRANITNATGIQQAIDLWTGTSSAAIPNGKLVCSPAPYNCGWSFHQDPATIQFADFTIEVCDGTPSYVDANCSSFGDQYCPWSATLVELRDCRTDKSCPLVPKN